MGVEEGGGVISICVEILAPVVPTTRWIPRPEQNDRD